MAGTTLRRFLRSGVGRERDSRASPGAVVLLPFRRDRLPRAAVFHTPSDWRPCVRAFDGSPRPPCDDRNGTALPPQLRGHLTAPQGARRASRGHPSTSARTPGLSIARASSLDHSPPSSRTWIRRPPRRRDEQESRPGSSYGGFRTLMWNGCRAETVGWTKTKGRRRMNLQRSNSRFRHPPARRSRDRGTQRRARARNCRELRGIPQPA